MTFDRHFMLAGALAYTVGALYAIICVLRGRAYPRRWVIGWALLGFALHTIGLYGRGMAVKGCPIGNPFEVLNYISWSLMALYVWVGSTFRTSMLGFFCVLLAALLGAIAFSVPAWDFVYAPRWLGDSPWIESHAALAFFSYGGFALLAVTGSMYLLQHFALKHKQLGGLFRFLPSLYQLNLMNGRLLWISTLVYSFSLGLGLVEWWDDLDSVLRVKLFFTGLLWLAYVATLVQYLRRRLLGVGLALSGVVLFLIALLVLLPVELNRQAATETDHTPDAHARTAGSF